MFAKIKNSLAGHPSILQKLTVRYGDFSPVGSSESLWGWSEGGSATAVFCLFHRAWESGVLKEQRWGLKWAAGRSSRELAQAIAHLPEAFRQIKAASVAVRAHMSNHSFIQMLERAGFHYVGGLVTLKMTPQAQFKPFVNQKEMVLRDAEKKDLLPLTKIAKEAFREGRFYHEPGLKANGAKIIYGAWAKNMLNYGDEVRVAAGKSPLGFVSLKKDPAKKRLWIDLIAVAPKAQSRGIGGLLAAESRQIALRQKGWDLAVKTEPENLGALRFYLKNGFELESFQLDYIWRP